MSQTVAAKPINKDKSFKKYINNCNTFINNFSDFDNCLNEQISSDFKISKRKLFDLQSLLKITSNINLAENYQFITNTDALKIWNEITLMDNKSSKKKIKIEEELNKSSCLEFNEYNYFIECYYKEFRNQEIYKQSSLLNKSRIESIMFNSLLLTKDTSFVHTFKIDNRTIDFDKVYEGENESDGFSFFFTMMNNIGTKYFIDYKKKKDKEDIKQIIKFIIIAIVMAYVAKKIFAKSSGSSGSSVNNSAVKQQTSKSTLSASSNTSYGYVYPGGPFDTNFMPNLFRSAPPNSILTKNFFKMGMLGF
jgi:hypothetical protein